MSVHVMSWVWRESKAEGPALLVMLAIADQAHEDGDGAWPSVPTLATKARVSERTVQRCIARLVETGELEVRRGEGRNGVNVYRVLMGRQPVTPPESHPATQTPVPESPRQAVAPSESRKGVTPVTPSGDTRVTRTVLEPPRNHPSLPKKLARDSDPRFVEFWSAYPNRTGKAAALKALAKVLAAGTPIEDVIKGAIRYRDDPRRDSDYTAHPATWLNAGRWTDEGPVPSRRTSDQSAYGERPMDPATGRPRARTDF